MTRQERKLIETMFYNYKKIFNNLVVLTIEWAESNMAVDYSKVAVSYSPGNYKEAQLCKILDKNQEKLRWSRMVERVLEHYYFDYDKIKFIQSYYFDKKGEVETCLIVGVCRATFFNWKNEILEEAYKWAREFNLL